MWHSPNEHITEGLKRGGLYVLVCGSSMQVFAAEVGFGHLARFLLAADSGCIGAT